MGAGSEIGWSRPGADVGENVAGLAGAPEIAHVLALESMLAADPGSTSPIASERLEKAAARLEAAGRFELLPLLDELSPTFAGLGDAPGRTAVTAVSTALALLARALATSRPAALAELLAAITDLRSARGARPLWRSPLVKIEAPVPAARVDASTVPDAGERRRQTASILKTFRRSLLALLTADDRGDATALAALCRRLASFGGNPEECRLWSVAGEMFLAAAECDQVWRPSLKRAAVKLEQTLRRLGEQGDSDGDAVTAQIEDLEALTLLCRAQAFGAGPAPLTVPDAGMAPVLEALSEAPGQAPLGRLEEVADAFLLRGDFHAWLEATRLRAGEADAASLARAAARWAGGLASDSAAVVSPQVSADFARAEAALGRIEALGAPGKNAASDVTEATAAETPAAASLSAAVAEAFSGIPVDATVLESLDLVAAEIRGARSKAEANLGTLRGGLADMERTIRALRSQLEELEADADTPSRDEKPGGVQARIGALSRGIEELAGLQDALHALTEETESVLATQASDETELEQGLLKTRLAPVEGQFDALRRCVERAATGWGVRATLHPSGGDVELERGQAEALTRALEPLLEACVREGFTGSASPARSDPAGAELALGFSRPRFDVRIAIAYRGAPLTPAVLARLTPALEALGAACVSGTGGDGRVGIEITVPGPPQSLSLVIVEVGAGRFGLPVAGVAGVVQPSRDAPSDAPELAFAGESYRREDMAEVLGIPSVAGDGKHGPCVLLARDGDRVAFRVDRVIGREQLLVRSPGPLLGANRWVFGVVLDALAAPTLVLDADALIDAASTDRPT